MAFGCLASVKFDASMLGSLRKAAALKVGVTAGNGAEVPLSVSLKGFGQALDRAIALGQ
jgi:invasion protein IalB